MATYTGLSTSEVDACREAFTQFDKDGSGEIDAWELREILGAMGSTPTDEQLFEMISVVDTNMVRAAPLLLLLLLLRRCCYHHRCYWSRHGLLVTPRYYYYYCYYYHLLLLLTYY